MVWCPTPSACYEMTIAIAVLYLQLSSVLLTTDFFVFSPINLVPPDLHPDVPSVPFAERTTAPTSVYVIRHRQNRRLDPFQRNPTPSRCLTESKSTHVSSTPPYLWLHNTFVAYTSKNNLCCTTPAIPLCTIQQRPCQTPQVYFNQHSTCLVLSFNKKHLPSNTLQSYGGDYNVHVIKPRVRFGKTEKSEY